MSYTRTPAGDAEAKARALPLSVPLRRVLNLIAQNTPADALRTAVRFGDLDRTLGELIERGLIVGEAPPSAAPAVALPRATVSAGAPAGPPPLIQTYFAGARQQVVRFLIDNLGPQGESLALRVERTTDPALLEQIAFDSRRVLHELRGRAVADKYVETVLQPVFGLTP
jgi:hypothetical protein